MNNLDEKIKNILSEEQIAPLSFDFTIKRTINNLKGKKKLSFKNIKTCIAIVCCFSFIITGVVFAKDIESFIKKQFENFNMGNGVTTAIDNGYIGKSDNILLEKNVQMIENDKIIDNINMKYKTEDFIMTDSNLNISFHFELENKINNYVDLGKIINGNIDYEGSHSIELSDLFIVDENNNVLYCNVYDSSNFETYCKKAGIDYNLKEKIYTNASTVREYYYTDDTLGLDLVCNISSSKNYPNSRKLNIYFTKIKLVPKYPDKSESRQITLEGNFEIHMDIPQIMYNRESVNYEVINCDNDDFEIYETKLTNTGFEIGLTINNIKEPVYPSELLKRQEELRKSYTVEEINSR